MVEYCWPRDIKGTAPVVKPDLRHSVEAPIGTASSTTAVIREDKTEWETDSREEVNMTYVICKCHNSRSKVYLM
jgi:hypothetical protein